MKSTFEIGKAVGRTARLGCGLLAAGLFLATGARAATSTIAWKDPLAYAKPAPIAVAEPNEASVTYKYYVDLSAGSGSTCSQSSPCGSLRALAGLPGMTGGPAYVYVRGTGNFYLYNDTFYGSPGNEIVIKPWGTSVATLNGGSNGGTFNGSGIHDIIVDGGSAMGIKWVSDSSNFAMHVLADNVTIWRTEGYCTSGSVYGLLSAGDFTPVNNLRIINNELHDCNQSAGVQAAALYVGPGSGGGYNGVQFLNNVVYNMGGEGLEINPRVTSAGMTITGNAIHNVGKQTCTSSWNCRPAITMSIQSGNGNNGTIIASNLMWDIGSGCVWNRGGGSPAPLIAGNTCYDFGKGTGGSGDPNPQGVSGYSNGGSGTVSDNIIYAPNGTAPLDSSPVTATGNLCASGKSCGSSSRAWSSVTVLSTDPTSVSFLVPSASSEVRGAAVALSGLTGSYGGVARPPNDIGAILFGGTSLVPPTNVTAVAGP